MAYYLDNNFVSQYIWQLINYILIININHLASH